MKYYPRLPVKVNESDELAIDAGIFRICARISIFYENNY